MGSTTSFWLFERTLRSKSDSISLRFFIDRIFLVPRTVPYMSYYLCPEIPIDPNLRAQMSSSRSNMISLLISEADEESPESNYRLT